MELNLAVMALADINSLEQVFDFAVAVPKRIQMNSNTIEQGEVEVGQRRSLFVLYVPAALQSGCSAARDQDRQVLVIVKAGITHAAAIQVDRVIEERAVPIGSCLHSLQKIREQRDVIFIDLRDLGYFHWIIAVMTDRMVRVGDADVRICTIALLARELERDDARAEQSNI